MVAAALWVICSVSVTSQLCSNSIVSMFILDAAVPSFLRRRSEDPPSQILFRFLFCKTVHCKVCPVISFSWYGMSLAYALQIDDNRYHINNTALEPCKIREELTTLEIFLQ